MYYIIYYSIINLKLIFQGGRLCSVRSLSLNKIIIIVRNRDQSAYLFLYV